MLNCSNERSEDWRETKPNSLSVNGTAGGKTVLVADIILLCGLFQYILTMCCAWCSLMVWYTFNLKDISISEESMICLLPGENWKDSKQLLIDATEFLENESLCAHLSRNEQDQI